MAHCKLVVTRGTLELMHNDEQWVRRAIELAAEARLRGDEPFGALLVYQGDVILEARNAVNTERDLTQHAELRLISKASRLLDPAIVAGATLYTSTEPCPRCAGAIYWAHVPRVVFGFSAAALREMTADAAEATAWTGVTTEGPVLEDEARSVHEGYW